VQARLVVVDEHRSGCVHRAKEHQACEHHSYGRFARLAE
jgi:hypothetical protein